MIEREDVDGVAVLRLAHGKASALDVELAEGIVRALDEVARSDARALVLTGTGSIFSAGVDLYRVVQGGEEYVSRFLPALYDAIRALFTFPKPAIAAANGHAIAGGCILVAACDYRLMAGGMGRIGVPELLVGVPFPPLALEVLRFALPPERVQEIVYTGKVYSTIEAFERGLVDEVTDPEVLRSRALEMARHFASLPGEAFRLTKRHLRQCALDRVERATDPEQQRELAAAWASDETRSRITAYLERTIGKRG